MAVEIGSSKPRSVDFTFEGQTLFVRQMPLKLGLRMQEFSDGESLPPDIVAEIIAQCVVNESGEALWSVERVLEFDLEPMLKLFSEVSGASLTMGDAEKN